MENASPVFPFLATQSNAKLFFMFTEEKFQFVLLFFFLCCFTAFIIPTLLLACLLLRENYNAESYLGVAIWALAARALCRKQN